VDTLPGAFSVYRYEFSNKLRGLVEIRLIGLRFLPTNRRDSGKGEQKVMEISSGTDTM
jgi:hypothetical protein